VFSVHQLRGQDIASRSLLAKCKICLRHLAPHCFHAKDICHACHRKTTKTRVRRAVEKVVNETTIPTSSRDISFNDFIRDNANYICQIVETYRQRFGCVCFYTLATNCYAFTYENVLCMLIFASLPLLNEKCAIFVCRSIRVQVQTTASFTREVEGDVQRVVGYFQTKPELINSSTNLDIDGIRSFLHSQIENFNDRGVGSPLIQFWNSQSSLQSTAHYTTVLTSHPLNGCKTSTASSTSATGTKSVSYGRYFPASTSLRVTRNAHLSR